MTWQCILLEWTGGALNGWPKLLSHGPGHEPSEHVSTPPVGMRWQTIGPTIPHHVGKLTSSPMVPAAPRRAHFKFFMKRSMVKTASLARGSEVPRAAGNMAQLVVAQGRGTDPTCVACQVPVVVPQAPAETQSATVPIARERTRRTVLCCCFGILPPRGFLNNNKRGSNRKLPSPALDALFTALWAVHDLVQRHSTVSNLRNASRVAALMVPSSTGTSGSDVTDGARRHVGNCSNARCRNHSFPSCCGLKSAVPTTVQFQILRLVPNSWCILWGQNCHSWSLSVSKRRVYCCTTTNLRRT